MLARRAVNLAEYRRNIKEIVRVAREELGTTRIYWINTTPVMARRICATQDSAL